ncbi:MAG TPA: 4-hydroxy-tetrahydrodipicolinate reductase, partial [Acidimicrobiales bacterium]|nr:4-hydroxy-tetrahydrodipicolinate reductase [Acidimicrobiales bacterium]
MGTAVCAAVRSDPDLDLVGVVDPAYAGKLVEAAALEAAAEPSAWVDAGVDVAVDFTVASAVPANAEWCAAHGVHAVIGTTGFGPEILDRLRQCFEGSRANCVVAPNFAIGAVLMMRFAEMAAPFFETAEVIELHHDTKVDAPSGTASLTARRIAAARDRASPAGAAGGQPTGPAGAHSSPGPAPEARGVEEAPGVQVHSVRLRGLVAHQEVLFGT